MGDKESDYMQKFERYIFYLLLAAYIGVFLFYHDGEYYQIISGIIMLVLALTSLYFALCYKMGWGGREKTEKYRIWLPIGVVSLSSVVSSFLQGLGFLTMGALSSAVFLLAFGFFAFREFKSKWAVIFLIIPLGFILLILRYFIRT